MQKYLILFLLVAALCFSACADVDSRDATGSGTIDEEAAESALPANETGQDSAFDVLNHYSDLFIVSKVSSNLNLRDTPSTKGAVIGKIAKNAGGEILEDLGTWYRVRSGGLEGYVASKYCVSGKEARSLAASVAVRMAYIKAEHVNVRSGPGLDFEIRTQLGTGDHFPVIEDLGEWYRISIGEMEGYISKDYAEPRWYLMEAVPCGTGISVKRQKLLNYAEKFIGIPYKLGGTSLNENGIDCANFVHECLENALGIGLDRTSGQLAARGYRVSLDDAKPGDLMFYADKSGKLNHVAFYLGDGWIIHAAQSIGQVSISAYNYASEPVLIKNVIGN